jgi:hypothetical protein
MKDKKPRSEFICGTTAGETTELSVGYDPITVQIRFGHDMIDTRVETSYSRQKGPKILNRIPLSSTLLKTNPNEALAANYDILFAVDTNKRSIKGLRFSVTGVIEARHTRHPVTGSAAFAYHTPFLLEFTQVRSERPENLGWMVTVQNIEADPRYGEFGRIGLIVDSDLQNLQKYNERKVPIHENWFLPRRFTLVYASADVGREYLANRLIHAADTASRMLLDLLERGKVSINEKRVEGAPYASLRKLKLPTPPAARA